MASLHSTVLVVFAAMLGLFEGPAEIACVAVLVTCGLAGGYRRWRPGLVETGLLVWGLAGLYGLTTTAAHIGSEDKFRPLLALAFIVGARALARADDRSLRRMAWAFGVAMVINGAYGYLQLLFRELPLDAYLAKNRGLGQRVVPGHYELRAASGLFYNRLKLAHVGIVALGIIGCAALTARPPMASRRRQALFVGGLVLAGSIALTYARMALVALGVSALALVVLLVWRRAQGPDPKLRRRLALGLGMGVATLSALGLVLYLSPHGSERFTKGLSDLAVRLNIYRIAWDVFSNHPLLGAGHGVYSKVAPLYAPEGYHGPRLVDGHSLFMHTLAETGLVGFLGFMTALTASLIRLVRRVRRARELGDARALLERSALFCLVAYLCLGLIHFPLHHATVALLFWAAVGVASASAEQPEASVRAH